VKQVVCDKKRFPLIPLPAIVIKAVGNFDILMEAEIYDETI
jgi:hypothetical protein